ncbi:MAG: efflux RND transporter periplasmic adaptor subunit [Candidatus Schekmanbacteria bacterium]|nr:MAG: efflux RND transporter periplasmic adaptor subunit [Candidatus Schekmanbacteria bacterium]
MTPKRKKILIALSAVVFLFLGYRIFIAVSNGSGDKKSLEDEGIPVMTSPVSIDDIDNIISMTGDTYPNVGVEIVSKVTGRIEDIKVGIGDKVKKGDVLAVIEHKNAELKVREAEAALKVALANLEKAKSTLEREKAEYESAEALYKNGMISNEEYRKEKEQYLSAMSSLKLAQAQANDEKRAKLEIAKKELADCWIRSPINGIVTRQNVDIGTMVYSSGGGSKPLFTVENLEKIKVLVKVPAKFASYVKLGQKGEIIVPAMGDKVFVGKVTRVSPSLDQNTRSAVAIVQIDNSDMELKSGLFVEVRIYTETVKNALLIPRRAVFRKASDNYVFVFNEGKAKLRKLKTGIISGDYIQVIAGLNKDEEVIVSNRTRLYDGIKVRKVVL